jgi:hypothetical protein
MAHTNHTFAGSPRVKKKESFFDTCKAAGTISRRIVAIAPVVIFPLAAGSAHYDRQAAQVRA